MSNILTLALKGVYFDQIKAGTKLFEYRLRTPYWEKRMERAPFDSVLLTRGYPDRRDLERRMELPWLGYRLETILHSHFGPLPVEVFAIRVADC